MDGTGIRTGTRPFPVVFICFQKLMILLISFDNLLYLSICSKSSARPATNRRNAMRRAEANAEWGALDFEQEL